MRSTSHSATIQDFVEETTAGDIVTVETKKGKYLNEQRVCEIHSVQGGKIVCITVGGQIPMMILETISDDTYTYAYTYKNEQYVSLDRLRKYGVEGHPKSDNYEAEGWLDVQEFTEFIG
jgi:hypothetical protein